MGKRGAKGNKHSAKLAYVKNFAGSKYAREAAAAKAAKHAGKCPDCGLTGAHRDGCARSSGDRP